MRSTIGVLRESIQKGGRVLWHPAPFLLLTLFLVPAPGPDNKSLLGLPPLCPTKVLFNLPCPGCGMSRSLVCCAHGELTRAFWLHPLGPVFFGLLVGAVALRFFPRLQPSPKLLRVSSWVLVVLLLLLWVTRLLGWLPKPP